ncbi:S1-like domain-containing protein [Golovinomyces cichoracearum]|uniref:S1-like domain-containing protein n=1 Tax=Golovinomyces cichoracearum TaxID=62708 RepID=A0A420IYA4_9PEZI|nr:S1-like domain-containing protein [Golovinomyces cichoracearum]RKF79539.1 S1-like domain-containing protein [Golovinomyces cichoracearum]
MGRPKRNIMAVVEETCNPPTSLSSTESIARIVRAEGNNIYSCSLPNQDSVILVELPSRFRNTIWLKRGGYVLIDTKEATTRQNKIHGVISNIVRLEHLWRKQPYWPKQFIKATDHFRDENDGQESTVGKMPPLDSEEE